MLCLTLFFALVLPASAGTVTKFMELRSAAQVGGKSLEPGTYRVDMYDDGKVTFKKGKELVAEAKGEWVDGKTKAPGDTFIIEGGAIKEIRIEGRSRVLMIR
jgi:hypothetical protein